MLKNSVQIGKLIKQYRLEHNLSQQNLAKTLNVTISAISAWERGISKPGIDVLYQLAQSMQLSLDELLTTQHSHQTLECPHAFLDPLDFNDMHITLTEITTSKNRLHIGYELVGPKVSPKRVSSRFHALVDNQAPIQQTIKQSTHVPSAAELFNFKAVTINESYTYTPFNDIQLSIMYETQSYQLPLFGMHIQLIDQGPAMELHTLAAFGQMMGSKDYQIAFRFLAQNGHFRKLEENMQTMIEKTQQ